MKKSYTVILTAPDSDVDERALVQRVYQKFGYQPMYVQLVTAGALPVYRLLSPQVVRP